MFATKFLLHHNPEKEWDWSNTIFYKKCSTVPSVQTLLVALLLVLTIFTQFTYDDLTSGAVCFDNTRPTACFVYLSIKAFYIGYLNFMEMNIYISSLTLLFIIINDSFAASLLDLYNLLTTLRKPTVIWILRLHFLSVKNKNTAWTSQRYRLVQN